MHALPRLRTPEPRPSRPRPLAPLIPALAALLVLLGGCTSAARQARLAENERILTPHILQVDREGRLIAWPGSARSRVVSVRVETETYIREQLIEPMTAALQDRARYGKGVIIFLHGGLNTTEISLGRFLNSHDELTRQGYYPIFVAWPSGLLEAYRDHLLFVRQGQKQIRTSGEIFKAVTVPLVLVQDILTGAARAPMVLANTLYTDVQSAWTVQAFANNQVEIYKNLRNNPRYGDRIVVGNDYVSLPESTGRTGLYLATLPSKLVTGTLVVDSYGRPAWDNLKRRTLLIHPGRITAKDEIATEFVAAGSFTEKEQKKIYPGGFTAFIRQLEAKQHPTPEGGGPRAFDLTLVGHSMGTIVLSHLLSATSLDASRITYLAAACSIREFNESVLPYLDAHPDTRFNNVMLHPRAETAEMQTMVLDLPPRGSLLVWIDNFLANPVHEQDRTFGRWSNLFVKIPGRAKSSVQQILDASPNVYFYAFNVGAGEKTRGENYQWNEQRTAASPEAEPARLRRAADETYPEKHGDLSDLKYWNPEILPEIVSRQPFRAAD